MRKQIIRLITGIYFITSAFSFLSCLLIKSFLTSSGVKFENTLYHYIAHSLIYNTESNYYFSLAVYLQKPCFATKQNAGYLEHLLVASNFVYTRNTNYRYRPRVIILTSTWRHETIKYSQSCFNQLVTDSNIKMNWEVE